MVCSLVSPFGRVVVRLRFPGMIRFVMVVVREIACTVWETLICRLSVALSSPVESWTWSVHESHGMSVRLNARGHDGYGAGLALFDLRLACDYRNLRLTVCGHCCAFLDPFYLTCPCLTPDDFLNLFLRCRILSRYRISNDAQTFDSVLLTQTSLAFVFVAIMRI